MTKGVLWCSLAHCFLAGGTGGKYRWSRLVGTTGQIEILYVLAK